MEALPSPANGAPEPIRDIPSGDGGHLAQPDMRRLVTTALELGWSLWAYEAKGHAHTNFMILGHILSIIGKKPLATLLQEKVLGPMGLTNTTSSETSTIPEPVRRGHDLRRCRVQLPRCGAQRE
jgi:CubicO group peptidase (beta-lactamase class C family)